jgi:hypothetical protein
MTYLIVSLAAAVMVLIPRLLKEPSVFRHIRTIWIPVLESVVAGCVGCASAAGLGKIEINDLIRLAGGAIASGGATFGYSRTPFARTVSESISRELSETIPTLESQHEANELLRIAKHLAAKGLTERFIDTYVNDWPEPLGRPRLRKELNARNRQGADWWTAAHNVVSFTGRKASNAYPTEGLGLFKETVGSARRAGVPRRRKAPEDPN